MEVSRGDGSLIAVEVAGDQGGRPVLFCHGLADSRLSAQLFAPAARELGLRLVAPDRPGSHCLVAGLIGRELTREGLSAATFGPLDEQELIVA
ncbi:MAG TPA: hypothetical protein VE733_13365 [Streptosporangiaceae bacterium]|jgi:pimeloyl-ACP methyl ester carboxylesterase|nr:hypothetical protein [Streptosporangiaceae bacterium]